MSKDIFNALDIREIKNLVALVDKVENTGFSFFKLESGDTKIVISKNDLDDIVEIEPVKSVTQQTIAPRDDLPAITTSERKEENILESASTTTVEEEVEVKEEVEFEEVKVKEEEGITIVKSPSHGIFYMQPEPGAQKYVEVGSKVKAGDTVGLLEIMKIFSAVTTHVSGKVVEIYAKNEQLLKPGYPILAVKHE